MKLHDILIEGTDRILVEQKEDGSFPEGHNGPYFDPETPVRNTSHWLITLLKVYEITKEEKYKSAAHKALEYLLSSKARPMQASFWHRKNPKKDFSNGIMGQAWTIEALVEAHNVLKSEEALKVAQEIFLLHPYLEEEGGWMIVNVDGSYARPDGTFNHQLWFAAVGSMLISNNTIIKERVFNFLNRLDDHLVIYSDGCIKHLTYNFLAPNLEKKVVKFIKQNIKGTNKKYMRMKSVGYHGFNLYAFGLFFSQTRQHSFWKNEKFRKTIEFAKSEKFKVEIGGSKYGFPYNPPGFEVAYCLQQFEESKDNEIEYWVKRQLDECYNFEEKSLNGGKTEDKVTASARLYECSRLDNIVLD